MKSSIKQLINQIAKDNASYIKSHNEEGNIAEYLKEDIYGTDNSIHQYLTDKENEEFEKTVFDFEDEEDFANHQAGKLTKLVDEVVEFIESNFNISIDEFLGEEVDPAY
ncbi:hypothetical protein [Aureivirga marina]|uniref:hypothetical protein n=1 Tax=Aureivirga marina TaxID=1182451 RepID=UPI0018C9FF3F|nr:hypothetical protein [Aureivirga marina]